MKQKHRAVAALILIVGVLWFGYAKWQEHLPQIRFLRPHVTVHIFDQIQGVAERISPDGRHYAVTADWTTPLVSLDGGPLTAIPGLPPNSRAFVGYIANDGTLYGGYEDVAGTAVYSFRKRPGKAIELHWPNQSDCTDLRVNSGNYDGTLLTGVSGAVQGEQGYVWRRDRATPLTPPSDYFLASWASGISDDGRKVSGRVRRGYEDAAILWEDNTPGSPVQTSQTATLSGNGRFAILHAQGEMRLYEGDAFQVLSKTAQPGPSLKERLSDWWSRMHRSVPSSRTLSRPSTSLRSATSPIRGSLFSALIMEGNMGRTSA